MLPTLKLKFKILTLLAIINFARPFVWSQQKRHLNNYFWNIPTFQCHPHKINFTTLAEKYGIKQNQRDQFRGDVIAIFYDPGAFPAILQDVRDNSLYLRNGGIPQLGNLTFHLTTFESLLNELLPNKDFGGVGIIDFESWRPVFRQNFGTLKPYQDLAIETELKSGETKKLSLAAAKVEAAKKFEFFGRKFMAETLALAKQLRPKASWGYYGYPFCFNTHSRDGHCDSKTISENDNLMTWLWELSDNLHPSIYIREMEIKPGLRANFLKFRIDEAMRLNKKFGNFTKRVLPYFWYKYPDTYNFLSKEDIRSSMQLLLNAGGNEIILWGSSKDVNSKKNCQTLYEFIDKILGPELVSFTN